MNSLQMEERLWEYIDGVCNAAEKVEIELLLQTQSPWKTKYEELLRVHELINSSTLEEPSMRFTQNVMEEIARFHIAPATRTYIDKRVIYGIGGFFIAMIAGLLIYSVSQINWANAAGSGTPFNVDKIEWSRFFNNTYTNIFMMINVVLGLMLLDKYLTRKKHQAKSSEA